MQKQRCSFATQFLQMKDKLIVPNEFLAIAEEELLEGRSVKILADGASMNPFIIGGRDYSEVIPFPKYEEPELWNAYLFKWNGKYVIHRFIGKTGDIYRMLGDGNLKYEETVSREDIIGVLSKIHKPDGNYIDTLSTKWKRKGKNWHQLLPLRRYLLAAFRRLRRLGLMQ